LIGRLGSRPASTAADDVLQLAMRCIREEQASRMADLKANMDGMMQVLIPLLILQPPNMEALFLYKNLETVRGRWPMSGSTWMKVMISQFLISRRVYSTQDDRHETFAHAFVVQMVMKKHGTVGPYRDTQNCPCAGIDEADLDPPGRGVD